MKFRTKPTLIAGKKYKINHPGFRHKVILTQKHFSHENIYNGWSISYGDRNSVHDWLDLITLENPRMCQLIEE
jgi:hypothetical protein